MRRILVIQHEAYEVLGTLDAILKREKFRLRYINFDRNPEALPELDKYNALILLGGYMGVYESDKHPHLKVEMSLIEAALKKEIPILGICLGSQILAHVLGSNVRRHHEREMGWIDVHLTEQGKADPILGHFQSTEKLFQSHGDTYDIPASAIHLASSDLCAWQAFRYGDRVYGLQFHLEVNQTIVDHWLTAPENLEIFDAQPLRYRPEKLKKETALALENSMKLSETTFQKFLKILGPINRKTNLGSGHEKS